MPPTNEQRTWFLMDGTRHRVGDEDCCTWAKVHEGCGGIVHSQAVYGPSIIYECDRCGWRK
jgi:hypothetical protein